jgi:hypothetical protein
LLTTRGGDPRSQAQARPKQTRAAKNIRCPASPRTESAPSSPTIEIAALLAAHEKLSAEQVTPFQNRLSKKKYIIPSHVTVNQKKLYQVFGLKRSDIPNEMN